MISPIYLVDSSIYIFRSYFGAGDACRSATGRPTGAVLGFAWFLLRLLVLVRPARVAAAFDESLFTGFRHQLYPDYKANRVLPDEDLAFQLNACKQVAAVLGIVTFASSTHEADDLVASLARFARERQQPVCILSRDKDLQQLLIGTVEIHEQLAGGNRGRVFTRSDFIERHRIRPEQWPFWQALAGDMADSIPGLPGVGAKTATALVQHYQTLAALLTSPEQAAGLTVRGAARLPGKIVEHSAQLSLMLRLTTLVDDLPLVAGLNDLNLQSVDPCHTRELFATLGLIDVAGFRTLFQKWEQSA